MVICVVKFSISFLIFENSLSRRDYEEASKRQEKNPEGVVSWKPSERRALRLRIMPHVTGCAATSVGKQSPGLNCLRGLMQL